MGKIIHFLVVYRVIELKHEINCLINSKKYMEFDYDEHIEIKYVQKTHNKNLSSLDHIVYNTCCRTGHLRYEALKILGYGNVDEHQYLL